MASSVTELLRRRFGGKKDSWQQATLNYTDGDSFILMDVQFNYDSTNNVYHTDGTMIYPNEMIVTLDQNANTTNANLVLFAGEGTTQNEVWQIRSSLLFVNFRFDSQVIRNLRSIQNENIYEIRLVASDKSVWLNGSNVGNYLGTMKISYFNGRNSSYHTDCNKVLSVKVK